MSRKQKWTLLSLGLLVFLVALLLRWGLVDQYEGRGFSPGPDSLEYAAAAHSIGDTGKYHLAIGGIQVRPRYPAGWPLLLSISIFFGLVGEDLVLMTGLVAALHALLLASLAFLACRIFTRDFSKHHAANCAISAFAIAGFGWALCPISIENSRYISSDEAAALFGNAGLALLLFAFLCRSTARHTLLACLLAGICIGIAGAVRPVSNYLLLGPGLLCCLAAFRMQGVKPSLWRLCSFACGLAPVVLLVFWLLVRSGHDPWTWSAYGFWVPESYPTPASPGYDRTFNTGFAFAGNPAAPFTLAGRALGHLEIAWRLFFGMLFGAESATAGRSHGLGLVWPVLGWGFGGWLILRAARANLLGKTAVWTTSLALLAWCVGHVVLYSLYFYPTERFYLAPLAWCWIFTGIGLPLFLYRLWVQPRGFLCFPSLLVPSGIAISVLLGLRPLLATDDGRPHADNEVTRRMFARWRSWSDEERAQRFIPFDPVRVQALGLLDPKLRQQIKSWGKIPVTGHRQQLIEHGLIPELAKRKLTSAPDGEPLFPQGTRAPGVRRVRFDPADRSYHLWLEDLEGEKLVEYRIPLASQEAQQGLLRVEEVLSGTVVLEDAGLSFRTSAEATGDILTPRELAFSREHAGRHEARLLSHGLNQYRQSVKLEYEDRYRAGERTYVRRKSYELRIVGRSLELLLASHGEMGRDASFDYAGVNLGQAAFVGERSRAIDWPGLRSLFVNKNGLFVSRLASGLSPRSPREQINERLWLTHSRRLEDCLPVQDLPPGIETPWTREASAGDLLLRGDRLAALLLGEKRTVRPLVDSYLLHGLQQELRSAGRMELVFKDADEDSRNIAVGPALARGMGPDNARMQFYSQNGLRLYVNHTERPWNIEHEGKAVLLPAGGFFAAAPSGLLLLFALHPKSARPFAYAWNPGHSEVLDSKGGTVAGEGLDVPDKARIDALLESGPPAEIIIKDLVHWNWIRIQGAVSSMSSNNQPLPKARSLAIRMVGDPVLSLGRREAKLRCVAIDAKGRERELGTGVEWLSLPRGIVEIDGRHLMTGKGPGSVVVIAKAMGLEARRTINVKFLRVSKLRTHMISSENAVLSYETGMRIHHASLLLTREGSKLMRILFADSDPSGRVHLLHLDSLESGQRYRASIVVQLRAQDAPITIRLRQAITVR